MATRPSRTRSRTTSRGEGEPAGNVAGIEAALPSREAGYTGRYLVLFASDAIDFGAATLTESTGLKLASSSDFKDKAPTAEGLAGADGFLLRDIGVAVVDSPPQQISTLEVSESSAAIAVEPERVVFALQDPPYPTFPVPIADNRSGDTRTASAPRSDQSVPSRDRDTASPTKRTSLPERSCRTAGAGATAEYSPGSTGPYPTDAPSFPCRLALPYSKDKRLRRYLNGLRAGLLPRTRWLLPQPATTATDRR